MKQITLRATVALLFGLSLLLGSCSTDKVQILSVDNFNLGSLTEMSCQMNVSNNSCSRIQLLSASINIGRNGQKVGNIALATPLSIGRHTTQRLTLPLSINYSNPLSAMALAATAKRSPQNIEISGIAVVKFGLFKKRLVIDSTTLKDIIDKFAPQLFSQQ